MKYKKYINPTSICCLVGLFILGAPPNACAASTLFRLEWSGASLSNTATAVGFMSIDLAIWPTTLSFNGPMSEAGITDFTLTVGGATFGNGDYGMVNFNTIIFDSAGVSLDMTRELVGQSTSGDPFGTPSMGGGGDFNLFGATPTDPNGVIHFTLAVSDGEGPGESMVLTSFAPSAVPEPSSSLLIGSSCLALFIRRRR